MLVLIFGSLHRMVNQDDSSISISGAPKVLILSSHRFTPRFLAPMLMLALHV